MRASGRALEQAAIDQSFRDLDGIERGALAEIVGNDPEIETVLDRRIIANAGDEGGVVAHAFDWRDVAAVLTLVDHENARRLAQNLARLFRRQSPFELDVDGLGMTYEHRHPHAGRGEPDARVEYLLGLDRHLPLLAGLAPVEKGVDMRNDVEGDLLGELLGLRHVGDEDALRLTPELIH